MDLNSARIHTFFRSTKKLLAIPFWIRLSFLIVFMMCAWGSVFFIALHRHHELDELSGEIGALTQRAEALEKETHLHKKMKEQIKVAQRDYLKQSVETMQLLQAEKGRVTALAKQFPDNTSLKERLLFLEGNQNRIHFDTIREGEGIEHHLTHRVQMDLDDLKKFLEAVDGDRYDATQKKPFLVTKKFDLIKCYEKGDEKVYSIYAELIQK